MEFQPRLEILTKSPLILRDIDLLKKFKNLKVGISIGILNEEYAKQLEPCVASPNQRLETLETLETLEFLKIWLFFEWIDFTGSSSWYSLPCVVFNHNLPSILIDPACCRKIVDHAQGYMETILLYLGTPV